MPQSYIRVRVVVWAYGRGQTVRQTDTQTHTHTHRRAWPQYILRRLRLTQNVKTDAIFATCIHIILVNIRFSYIFAKKLLPKLEIKSSKCYLNDQKFVQNKPQTLYAVDQRTRNFRVAYNSPIDAGKSWFLIALNLRRMDTKSTSSYLMAYS